MSNHSNASHPSLPSPDLIADPDVRKQFTRLRQESTHHALPILWSADGDTTIRDLAEINHLFIAGAQGQGKSNFIHQILLSLLFTNPRNRMQLLLIDARAMELDRYRPLAASYLVTIPGNEPSTLPGSTASILVALQSLQAEITQRQDWFVQHNCRNMTEYVRWVEKQPYDHTGLVIHFPYLVVVVDELADLDLSHQREIRQLLEHMLFIAAKVGVHFILSTALTPIHPVPSSILSGIEERVIFRLFNRDDYRKLLYTVNFTPPGTKGDFVYLAHGKVAHGKTALIAVAVIDQLVRHLYQPSAPSHSFALPMSSTVAALPPRDRGKHGASL